MNKNWIDFKLSECEVYKIKKWVKIDKNKHFLNN